VAIEIRSARDKDEMKRYGEIVSYVFASTEGMDEELETTQPDWTTCGFVDGEMVATMGTFPFTVRLNGAPVKMGGVTAVGTLPSHRRRGLLRKIMHEGFRQMREREQYIAILWASMGAIYQRFGYGLMSTQVEYSFDPRYVALESGPEPTGSITMMSKEDAFPLIKQVYIQWATPRNLAIHRAVPLWEQGPLRPRKKGEPVHIAVYRNADGEVTGYMTYATYEGEHSGPGPRQIMEVKDFVHLDIDAFRGLWNFVRGHDLVGTVKMHNLFDDDDPAPSLLLEPRMLNRSTSDAIWGRIIDVEKALPQRPYGERGELTFAIRGDTMCEWNEGTWLMETDGRTTDIRRTDRTPDITMPINSLARLVSGNATATHLSRAGRLDVHNDRALATADRVFATEYKPHCPNGF
jgi:predicted acetyltransferase